jgi:hypothetical protein
MAKKSRKKAAAKATKKTKALTKKKAAKKSAKKTIAVTKKRRKTAAPKKPIAKKAAARKPLPESLLHKIEGEFTALVDTLTDAEHLHQKLDPGVSREPE